MTISFGRFTDAFKSKAKFDKWNECEKLYTDKNYLQSYTVFFDYLKTDDADNVFYNLNNGMLTFQLIQGSKEVRGFSDGKKVSAMAVVAGYDKVNVAAFRRLMEMNYSLYYSRFAVKDNKIVLKFDSNILDCSPNKLYYSLRELATRADKQDDMLLSEFKTLLNAEAKTEEYSTEETAVMLKYYRKWIPETLDAVSKLNREKMLGGISYIYLSLLYRIDYFLMPQGTIQNDIEKMSWEFFNDANSNLTQRINNLEEEIKRINGYDDEKIKSNFYKVKATFGVSLPTHKKGLDDVITNNINNIKYYIDNNHTEIALNILEYIPGFSLCSYGLNVSIRKMLGLLMQVMNNDFVNEINAGNNLTINDLPNKDEIVKLMSEYIALDKAEYPELTMDYEKIKFDTKLNFIKTTLEEILKLNYKN